MKQMYVDKRAFVVLPNNHVTVIRCSITSEGSYRVIVTWALIVSNAEWDVYILKKQMEKGLLISWPSTHDDICCVQVAWS